MYATKHALVVDDNKEIITILGEYLKNMGCFATIVTANDGQMALNKLANQKFDVILLDLELPKISGMEIVKEIAADKRAVNELKNIIIVSGTLDKDKMQKIINMGIKNFLIKPFDEKAFQEKVLKILTNK